MAELKTEEGRRILITPYYGSMPKILENEVFTFSADEFKSAYDPNDPSNYETNTKMVTLHGLLNGELDMPSDISDEMLSDMRKNSAYSRTDTMDRPPVKDWIESGYKRPRGKPSNDHVTYRDLALSSRLNSPDVEEESVEDLGELAQGFMDYEFADAPDMHELRLVRPKENTEEVDTDAVAQEYLDDNDINSPALDRVSYVLPKSKDEDLDDDMGKVEQYVKKLEGSTNEARARAALKKIYRDASIPQEPKKGLLGRLFGR